MGIGCDGGGPGACASEMVFLRGCCVGCFGGRSRIERGRVGLVQILVL